MTYRIAILCFPGVQQLDLTAPYEVFASTPGCAVTLLGKDLQPVHSATGLQLQPTQTLAEAARPDAPAFDVLCVPGGGGVNALLHDQEVLEFLRLKAPQARYVTAVCTGSLVLGQAGLLQGKRATTHWNAMDLLPHFGAIPVPERVVQDGNLITAGGVTAGMDFALSVIGVLCGPQEAQTVQLALEYAPAPPFDAGRPDTAPPEVLACARTRLAASRSARLALLGLD